MPPTSILGRMKNLLSSHGMPTQHLLVNEPPPSYADYASSNSNSNLQGTTMTGNNAAQNAAQNMGFGSAIGQAMSTQQQQMNSAIAASQLASAAIASNPNLLVNTGGLGTLGAGKIWAGHPGMDRTRVTMTIAQITNGYLVEYSDPKTYSTKQIFCSDLVDVGQKIVGVYAAMQMED